VGVFGVHQILNARRRPVDEERMWPWILLGVLGVVVFPFVAAVLRLRRSIRTAAAAIEEVALEDVSALCDECVEVFRNAFGEDLDLDDFEGATRLLSDRFDQSESLKEAFAKDDFDWYFALPVGAFIGELLRTHVDGAWREEDLGLVLSIPVGDDSADTLPFHKVMKQAISGDPGDVYAYFMASRELDQAAGIAVGPGDGTA